MEAVSTKSKMKNESASCDAEEQDDELGSEDAEEHAQGIDGGVADGGASPSEV